jgi:hypothetical protein
MLKSLRLHGIGPVKDLAASFGPRLNIVTGDNGLGKSFLLDLAFWVLTGTWPGGRVAMPEANGKKSKPRIVYEIEGKKKTAEKEASYDWHTQSWKRDPGRPIMPGLVIYAAVDGGFAVWDPARNYWRQNPSGQIVPADQPRAYQFTAETLANEYREGDRVLSNGLVNDWRGWYYQSSANPADKRFELLQQLVAQLAHPDEPMTVEPPQRVYVDDSRAFPVIRMPYGPVSYPHWSAAVRRIICLAYLLVWSWDEHAQAAKLRGESPTNRLILLIDEVEAHLHPKWQRAIMPALVQVIKRLWPHVRLQALATTHSPLLLASLEPLFEEDHDRLFCFDLQDGVVHFKLYPWAKQGDADSWLTSDIFGLKRARSRDAEDVIEAAEKFMAGRTNELPVHLSTKDKIQREMERVLPGVDPIWPRWRAKTERRLAT